MGTVERDVSEYEAWLPEHCDVVDEDLDAKHRRMRKSVFDFLRASYFRWARTIESLCPELASATSILCVGDIHVENYGTWRDADARLVWGINDFDEAAVMPFAFDLVRLTTSALLAPDIELTAAKIAASVLRGYRAGLAHPHAVLLDEGGDWLRAHATPTSKSSGEFWKEIDGYGKARPPTKVKAALVSSLPEGAQPVRFAARRKGGGSLGRPRFLAIASWNSGRVVREAKALVPSAWAWAHDSQQSNRFQELACGSFRSPDPELREESGYVLRRIAPDSRKIEFADVRLHGLTEDLLWAMAADLASVHAASGKVARIAKDLASSSRGWLRNAAGAARSATENDFREYRRKTR